MADLSLADSGFEKTLPCPDSESIAPCNCTISGSDKMVLDSKLIESETDLPNIFLQEFPVKTFSEFRINSTSVLTNLDFSLQGLTFEVINFSPGPLSIASISDFLFLDSADVLTSITITDSGFLIFLSLLS